ncbi:hypothetical protein [Spirosoma agri]|uniref:HNH endonuclease n=1 Tax=Spirosoma agri TaxID=1987381 RepID=A0A6M0ILJ8_9BACT|nr:hypothetical protein [Spirosoma agri]NEU68281.1 hypothetical protein [Spirosoma agri]
MPITPDNKARYPRDWKQISQRIRTQRAGNKCEVCGLLNGSRGWRTKDGTFYSVEGFAGEAISPLHEDELCKLVGKRNPITIVLTVAHLDHTPENCADDNLKAMCQQCHNRYDMSHRQANARKTRLDKIFKKQLTLFA